MRAIAGSILILAAVLFHQSPATSRPVGLYLLCLIVLVGAFYLVTDVASHLCPPYVAAIAARFWRWLLNGSGFLIKGTLLGALVGVLANLALFGPSRIGNLAAIPGAFVGLVLGVVLDAVAHRHRHRRLTEPAAANESSDDAEPFADDRQARLVESHGWDLSLGVTHTIPDWPRDSNPIERQ
ncbi:MAG TPA: hypothetical protein VG826_25895 [Pirellulales bacterium]|nr:hypothetical protein [Pirellulales bacterium]